jgi:hypothetical protein
MLFPSIFEPRPSWLLTQHQSRTSFPQTRDRVNC